MATATIPAGSTAAATVHLRRRTNGRAVQRTPWTAVTGDTATAAPQTDAGATSPRRATALLTDHITNTGPPTALATTPPPDAMPTPRILTAGAPPQKGTGAAATTSQTGWRPY